MSKSTTGLPQAEPLHLVRPGQRLSMKDKPWGPLMLASGCHPSVMVGPPHGSVNLDELLPLSGLQLLTCGVMAPALDRLCDVAFTMSGTPHTPAPGPGSSLNRSSKERLSSEYKHLLGC